MAAIMRTLNYRPGYPRIVKTVETAKLAGYVPFYDNPVDVARLR